jgi:hypothetical protein
MHDVAGLGVDAAGLGVTATGASLAGVYDMALGKQGAYVAGLPDESPSLHEVTLP